MSWKIKNYHKYSKKIFWRSIYPIFNHVEHVWHEVHITVYTLIDITKSIIMYTAFDNNMEMQVTGLSLKLNNIYCRPYNM